MNDLETTSSTISFENDDLLDRKEIGEKLLRTIQNIQPRKGSGIESVTVSLEGGWGTGKTTFVTMWQQMLKDKDIPCIYIDAFKHDYSSDPFLLVASHILDYSEKKLKQKDPNLPQSEESKIINKNFIDRIIKIVRNNKNVFALSALKLLLKQCGINPDIIEQLFIDSSKNDDQEEKNIMLYEGIKEQVKTQELIEGFQKTLKELIDELPCKPDNKNQLCIIIDELDRCRPTFAVEMLERIKHLFSVDNVAFVLVNNREHLKGSIQKIYGHEIDAHSYLQKFYTFKLELPSIRRDSTGFNQFWGRLIKNLSNQNEMLKRNVNLAEIKVYVSGFHDYYHLSLRELEKIAFSISLCSASIDFNFNATVITFLSVIKLKDEALYNNISKSLKYPLFFPSEQLISNTSMTKNSILNGLGSLISSVNLMMNNDNIFVQSKKNSSIWRLDSVFEEGVIKYEDLLNKLTLTHNFKYSFSWLQNEKEVLNLVNEIIKKCKPDVNQVLSDNIVVISENHKNEYENKLNSWKNKLSDKLEHINKHYVTSIKMNVNSNLLDEEYSKLNNYFTGLNIQCSMSISEHDKQIIKSFMEIMSREDLLDIKQISNILNTLDVFSSA